MSRLRLRGRGEIPFVLKHTDCQNRNCLQFLSVAPRKFHLPEKLKLHLFTRFTSDGAARVVWGVVASTVP